MVGWRGSWAFAIACVPGLALAQNPMNRLFPNDARCYTQVFSAEHLTAYPAQRVGRIALIQDRDVTRPVLGLLVQIGLRDDAGGLHEAKAYCGNVADLLSCKMVHETGGFTVEPSREGKVLLRIDAAGLRIDSPAGALVIDGDRGGDRAFLLRPVVCR